MTRRSGPFRLAQGGLIDRARTVSFSFDGRTYTGHPGDSLASALLANGIQTIARSFKFHRPRAIFSSGNEEPNGLIQLGHGHRTNLSARAPLIELHEGLEAHSQRGWPSVRFDLMRALDFVAPLWGAGFYNKTFLWPSWHAWEPLIRRMAGLGHAPCGEDPDRYDLHNLHADVLVVGGGRAGLNAALQAAREGFRVALAEANPALGGHAASRQESGTGELIAQLARLPGIRILTRTTAVAAHDHSVVSLIEQLDSPRKTAPRERYWMVRAKRIVLATGATEQPLIFANNDRPGIMLAGAAWQYLRRYGVVPGRRILIATNNDSAYAIANDFAEAGVAVLAVLDTRAHGAEHPRGRERPAHTQWLSGSIPLDTSGFDALRSVTVGRLSRDALRVVSRQTFRCDALLVSGGFAPALQLYSQCGGKLAYDDESGVLQPEGEATGVEVVGSAARRVPVGPRVSPTGDTHRQWVDLAHDVTVADLELAVRENYRHVEHVKRYTTVGMAADQGKTSHAQALEIVGRLRKAPPRQLGHTTLRPPIVPVTLGAIAGRDIGERFAPKRRLPMHEWHSSNGAIFHDFGGWQRPVAYIKSGESREQAALREARAVRTAAGLFDGSSLGKIEIAGPDALEFLDRFYINNLKTLQPGRARYGLMLRETGILFDDGTIVALAPNRLLITTTSGNAVRVYQWLEEWRQCEWPSLRLTITPVTEQWAVLSLAGSLARTILAKLECDIDLAPAAFPHLNMREGTLLRLPARIYRVSFTGELTYEINVPADSGPKLWEALVEVGAAEGLQPIGLDALMQLRLEKGFLHVGTDSDGTTVPDDVGWGKVAQTKQADYIGKRSLALAEHVRADRLQLVGMRALGEEPFVIGSHLRVQGSSSPTDGWITSAGIATLTREPIALALLRSGRYHLGEDVNVFDDGALIGRARVVTPMFYDPTGERMHG
jgi:sarcosine oxidase, subunit alpha